MIANAVYAPKGPASLAKAGVSFADAQWLFAQKAMASGMAALAAHPRFLAIEAKVQAFAQRSVNVVAVEPAFA